VEVRPLGGFCVVASSVACLNILSDFVALRRRPGADSAVAGADARQRRAGGSTGPRGWRDAGSKRRGADSGAIGQDAASGR